MKKLLFILPLLLFLKVSAQKIKSIERLSDHSSYVKGNNFEGVIFSENYFQQSSDTAETKIKRFTPTVEDIILAERILIKKGNDTTNKGDILYIFNNLKKYHRQYIGYFNNKGERMIYVNCFQLDKDQLSEKIKKSARVPDWHNTLYIVDDGGRRYWQAHINLDKKEINDISVNGVA